VNDIINPRALAVLCAAHLASEETLLAAALPLVRALKAAFLAKGHESLVAATERHHPFTALVEDMKVQRRRFREGLARHLHCDADDIDISRILNRLPPEERGSLAECAERVRRMADEIVTLNYWLAVHLRIHLDAYQRLLCDLTGTAQNSGRYGPAGQPETDEFRPMLRIQG
jgi:hypothetical protein